MSYSANPFDLLGDEGDDRPRVKPPKPAASSKPAAQNAPAKPAASQQKAAGAAKPATGAPANAAGAKKENEKPRAPQGDAQKGKTEAGVRKGPAQPRQPREGGNREGGAGPRDGNFVDRPPRQPREQREPREPREGREPREPREGREPRERRGNAEGRPPRGGRVFDRRSGTGRPLTENKKQGFGKGNWGGIEEGQEPTEAPKEVVEGGAEEVPAEVEPAVEGEPQAAQEPEKELKGLDEYYESLKQKAVKSFDAPKLRAAGEGVDQSAWADYAPLAKDEFSDDVSQKKKAVKKPEANGKEDKVSASDLLNFTMVPPAGVEERRGGDRRGGGRGGKSFGGRGQGGRGGGGGRGKFGGDNRGPRGSGRDEPRLNPKDEAEFPTLGGSAGVSAPAQQASPAPVKA